MNKSCVVSFANMNGRYIQNLARLGESLRNNSEDIDFIGYIGERSIGAESHFLNPYNFKIHCFNKAIDAGYQNILYLDSSVFAIKPINSLFEIMKYRGMIYQLAGHLSGNWASDRVLEYFEIDRNEAMSYPMIGNAGMLGINTNNIDANTFLDDWSKSMESGMFKGAWNNNDKTESMDERCFGSRHDMICSSIILNQMGLIENAIAVDEVLQYGGLFSPPTLNDTIILKAEG